MAQARRGIHERHSMTPQRIESDQDDDDFTPNDSQESNTFRTGSDHENEEIIQKTDKVLQKQKRFERAPSVRRSPLQKRLNPEKSDFLAKPETANSNKQFFVYIFLVIAVVFAALSFPLQHEKLCSFEKLQQKFPTENLNLWKHLKVGIELILNERTQKPAVYLLAHHGSQHVFKLIKDIAIHSSGCFGKEMVPIQMESDDFISAAGIGDDYGHAIQKYKNKIKEGNVILIANLNEVPAEAARALHTICDTHSPIAKDVVIFLTLTIQANKTGSGDAIAEETLTELWGSKLGYNELGPLITRVTDEVIVLKS